MKVVLINHSDTLGGASVVTFRLMEALRDAGVDAKMLVTSKVSDSPHVYKAASKPASRIPFLAEHLDIFCRNGFSRDTLFKISTGKFGLPLSRHPLVAEADAVLLNWVNQGMLSLDEIGRIAARKPVIWTMHDMWNMTGICHHAADCERYKTSCGNCRLLNRCAASTDLSTRVMEDKRRLYESAHIHFVSVSGWLSERAKSSSLLCGEKVVTIPNAFPTDGLSRPADLSREKAGLPTEGKLIVLCAARLDDPIKGLPDAIAAFNTLHDRKIKATAILAGDIRNSSILQDLRLPYRHLGPIYDKQRLHSIYAHADVVLSSSSYESFGATLLEGQAAGAVPVGYVNDGRTDIITDGVSGYAAGQDRSLADAMQLALECPPAREALLSAASRYSYQAVANKYIDLLKNTVY